MPRRSQNYQPKGPSLTSDQARIQLERALERAKRLLQEQPLSEERYSVWRTTTFGVLEAAFGAESDHLWTFSGQARVSLGNESERFLEAERRGRLTKQIEFLEAVIEEFPPVNAQAGTTGSGSDFFDDLEADIRRVSEGLFKDGHYGESVSTAFKELNHQVKQEYTRRKGAELDGADLMHTAFSPKNPVFVLADQSKESGRNIQQGFMELFAGSMIGIRNPHAHENLSLDPDKAKHFLYLASLLMKTFKAVR
jgi:uncharacterized protein (TIGR02391 family)